MFLASFSVPLDLASCPRHYSVPDLVAKTRFLTHYAGQNKYLPIIFAICICQTKLMNVPGTKQQIELAKPLTKLNFAYRHFCNGFLGY